MINELINDLKNVSSEQCKKTYLNHGALEPLFGVPIGELKKLKKKYLNKLSVDEARELYKTNNYDVLSFLPMIYNGEDFTEDDFEEMINNANGYMIVEYSIADFLANTEVGKQLIFKWIEETDANKKASAYSALCNIINTDDVSNDYLIDKLNYVEKHIHDSENRVKYCMNSFIISCAAYNKDIRAKAIEVANTVGKVNVDHGNTSCKTPFAPDYIKNIIKREK